MALQVLFISEDCLIITGLKPKCPNDMPDGDDVKVDDIETNAKAALQGPEKTGFEFEGPEDFEFTIKSDEKPTGVVALFTVDNVKPEDIVVTDENGEPIKVCD